MSKSCARCGSSIEPERLSILSDTIYCSNCARILNPKRVKGAMIYNHKTAPTINVMPGEYFDEEWKRYNPRYGRGSGVHRMMPRPSGTA